MAYFVPFYILITAVNVVFYVLPHGISLERIIHAILVAVAASFALSGGNKLRSLFSKGGAERRVSRAVVGVILLAIAYWLGQQFSISLYFTRLSGIIWILIGAVLGALEAHGYLGSIKRIRRGK